METRVTFIAHNSSLYGTNRSMLDPIEPVKEHAKLFGLDICFFDPADPKDIADKIIEFEHDIDRYSESSIKASTVIGLINDKYMGKCHSEACLSDTIRK